MIKRLLITLNMLAILFTAGCGDVLDEKKTEVEAKKILFAASEVRDDKLNIDIPDRIQAEPVRLKTSKGVKLFYYTRHHSPDDMGKLVNSELKLEVTRLDSANQLIVSCPDDAAADGVLEFLNEVDIPPIQVRINCVVVENYADVTMDKETTVQVDNLLNQNIQLASEESPSLPGASIREAERKNMGLLLGYDGNGTDAGGTTAMVDMLVSRGYLKVLMNPTVETLVGRPATVSASERVPVTRIQTKNNVLPYQETDYIWIEDKLTVTPYVYQDGTIGLKTELSIGSKSTPEGVIQRTVITEKKATFGENRIRIGESLIVGGFRKMENSAVTRGIPFFKDIPLFGFLFTSDDYEQRAKDITIILTPSISSNGMSYEEMVEFAKEKFRRHSQEKDISNIITDVITDPLGRRDDYATELEKDAASKTIERIKTEIDVSESERELAKLKAQVNEYEVNLRNQQLRSKEVGEVRSEYEEKLKQTQEVQKKLEEHIAKLKAEAQAKAKAEADAQVAKVAEPAPQPAPASEPAPEPAPVEPAAQPAPAEQAPAPQPAPAPAEPAPVSTPEQPLAT